MPMARAAADPEAACTLPENTNVSVGQQTLAADRAYLQFSRGPEQQILFRLLEIRKFLQNLVQNGFKRNGRY